MPNPTGTPDSASELNADDHELIAAATSVMDRTYNPHSGWHVGAAVRTSDGRIFTGSFFEHATMGQTICAEPAAFIAANMAGHRDIVAVATVGAPGGEDGDEPCTPCGRCRQTIHEFSLRLGRPIRVLCARTAAIPISSSPTRPRFSPTHSAHQAPRARELPASRCDEGGAGGMAQ